VKLQPRAKHRVLQRRCEQLADAPGTEWEHHEYRQSYDKRFSPVTSVDIRYVPFLLESPTAPVVFLPPVARKDRMLATGRHCRRPEHGRSEFSAPAPAPSESLCVKVGHDSGQGAISVMLDLHRTRA
jgi:hypothetical protein